MIYEDEFTVAFLDINPVSHGHTLVVPKKHFMNMEEIPSDELCHVIEAVKKVGGALKKTFDFDSYNIQVNNGATAGQVIEHLHFHVIPRHIGDGLELWPQGKYEEGIPEELTNILRKELGQE